MVKLFYIFVLFWQQKAHATRPSGPEVGLLMLRLKGIDPYRYMPHQSHQLSLNLNQS
jgi:hypothetical protein